MINRLQTTMREFRQIRRIARGYSMSDDGPVSPAFADDAPKWPSTRQTSTLTGMQGTL